MLHRNNKTFTIFFFCLKLVPNELKIFQMLLQSWRAQGGPGAPSFSLFSHNTLCLWYPKFCPNQTQRKKPHRFTSVLTYQLYYWHACLWGMACVTLCVESLLSPYITVVLDTELGCLGLVGVLLPMEPSPYPDADIL